MASSTGEELLQTLLSRRQIAACLQRAPLSKPVLVEECDVSRSTIDRGIRELEAAGVVTRASSGKFELTLYGEIAMRSFEGVLDQLNGLVQANGYLDAIEDAPGMRPELFDAARIIRTREGVSTVLEKFAPATEIRLVNPPFRLVIVGLAADGPLLGMETTVLMRDNVLAEVSNTLFRLFDISRAPQITLFEIDDQLSYSFALSDGRERPKLYLLLGDIHDGMVVVESDSPEAVEWGEARYEELLADARMVD